MRSTMALSCYGRLGDLEYGEGQMGTIEIEGSAERIWEALASQDAWRDWFNPTIEIDPQEGGRVRFEGTRGDQSFVYDGAVASMNRPGNVTLRLQSSEGRQATLTVDLQPGTDFTTVVFRHDGFDDEGDDESQFWDGDELIPLREYVTGIGPTH